MAQPPQLYCADQVVIIWGAITMTGVGSDDFCKVERIEDSFKSKAGAFGDVVRSRMLDRRGKITVKLLKTSSTNIALRAAILLDENSNNGLSIFPAMVKDYGGNALWTATYAWLTRPASGEMAAEAGVDEWTLEVAELKGPLPVHA
jgi:hypothetical protein